MDGQTGDLVRISPFIPFILVRGETATLVCCHCIAGNISCLLNRKHRAPRTALWVIVGHSCQAPMTSSLCWAPSHDHSKR